MVMCEVLLSSLEQLLLGITCEFRPTVAVSDSPVPFDRNHLFLALLHSSLRPVEAVVLYCPRVHYAEELSIGVVDTFP